MSYTHKLIQILINQNEMNNKLICAFSLAPPIKRFCLFVAGVSALWGKIFFEITEIFHALAEFFLKHMLGVLGICDF